MVVVRSTAEHKHKHPTATKDSKVFLSADELKSPSGAQYVSRFGLTRVCLLGWFCCEFCLPKRLLLRRSLAIFSSGLFSFASVSLVHEEVLLSFFAFVCSVFHSVAISGSVLLHLVICWEGEKEPAREWIRKQKRICFGIPGGFWKTSPFGSGFRVWNWPECGCVAGAPRRALISKLKHFVLGFTVFSARRKNENWQCEVKSRSYQ